MKKLSVLFVLVMAFGFGMACGDDDDDGVEADQAGIGAECTNDAVCEAFCADTDDDGTCDDPAEVSQCLTQFKGGYCGQVDCSDTVGCPEGSACVAHTDGMNYCFRTCIDKAECNANRAADNEANCSSSVTFVDDSLKVKACVPPSN